MSVHGHVIELFSHNPSALLFSVSRASALCARNPSRNEVLLSSRSHYVLDSLQLGSPEGTPRWSRLTHDPAPGGHPYAGLLNYAAICAVSRAIGSGRLALVTVDAADMEVFDHILCRAVRADSIPHPVVDFGLPRTTNWCPQPFNDE
jgi:hypothetical protein